MRGTFFKSSHFSVARRRGSQAYFLLAFAIIFAAVSSGCASVSANKPVAEPATAQISVVPSAVDFKAVVVGEKNSQTVKITNTSKNPINLQQLRVSGSGFTLSSSSAAVSLAAGNAANLTVVFSPVNTSAAKGSLVISSAELKSSVTVPLAGSGEKAAAALVAFPASVNFGAHAVKSSTSQAVTLSNTGNISVSLSSVDLPGSAFSLSGLSKGVTLAPGQELQFQVWFRPGATGSAAQTLSINGSSLPAPLKIAFSGSASNSAPGQSQTPAHSVTLNWQPSESAIEGYQVYRGDVSGGPYKRVSASIVTSTSFKDDTVQGGGHYFYVVTSVKADGTESSDSNEVAVIIPSP